jgi:DNA adenine methylase
MKPPSRPLLRYLGGKWRLAEQIIAAMPAHQIYTEAFGGGGSVLLRKPRSASEVYNDLCGDVVNAFRQMRDAGPALHRLLDLTPFSREEYQAAYEPTIDPLEPPGGSFSAPRPAWAATACGGTTASARA